jgi:hypothetical protein
MPFVVHLVTARANSFLLFFLFIFGRRLDAKMNERTKKRNTKKNTREEGKLSLMRVTDKKDKRGNQPLIGPGERKGPFL